MIGENSYIGQWTHIGQNTSIGSYCSISNSCTIGAQRHALERFTTYPFPDRDDDGKKTIIGHDVWIGANCVVLSGVTVGTGAVIGAGSVVTRDVPPYAVVYGNPARVRRYRFDQKTITELLRSEWWRRPFAEVVGTTGSPLEAARLLESDQAYLIRRISPKETIDDLYRFPRYFEIETVNACNARCPMCTIADWNRKDGAMKDDLFEKIAAELQQHANEIIRVHLYRDGEPLLDKRLPQRIKRLKDAGIKKVGISTNAELLDLNRGHAILAAGIDEVILSIDSIHRKPYEAIRVGLDYDTVMRNAIMFFGLRDGSKNKCQIRVRMVRQENNNREWESGEFKDYWMPVISGNDTIEDHNLHNWGGQLTGYDSQGETAKPCIALWSLMCIFADGSVPMCNVDYNKRYPLGNVRDNTIAELWQSQTQNHRRNLHLDHHRDHIDLCKNCTVWSEYEQHTYQSGAQGAIA